MEITLIENALGESGVIMNRVGYRMGYGVMHWVECGVLHWVGCGVIYSRYSETGPHSSAAE